MTDSNLSYQELGPVAIIGGAGRMGRFFSQLFIEAQIPCHEIEISTPDIERAKILKDATVVIVSVPISITCQVLEEVLPLLSADCLLADLTSVKELPLRAMIKHSGEVLGLHPMFAPSPRGLTDQTVIVCEGRAGPIGKQLCHFIASRGARLKFLSAARHDQLMAIVQGLNHFHSIVFAHALGSLGIPVEDTIDVASPVYLLRMQLMGRILAQDPQLYADIQLYNPYGVEALKAFHASSEEFMEAILSGSSARCMEFFSSAAESFGAYRDTAQTESDALLAQYKPGKS